MKLFQDVTWNREYIYVSDNIEKHRNFTATCV